jgi:hypothetical protein
MAEAIINIGANTQAANAQIDQLNQNLGQTGAAADTATASNAKLEAQLKKQEATIKTIDGAVNLLGGSVELAAGAFVGLGLASGEQAEAFESAALGAIAFADGAKRTVDGVKSLNEGLSSFGGIAAAARKAQIALNTAILANPYIAAAVAVAALAAALVIYTNRETEAEKATKKSLETAKLRLTNLEQSESRVLAFARAQGLAAETVLEFEQASVKARIAEIDRILALEKDSKEFKRLSDEQNKLLDKEIELALAAGKIKEDARQADIKAAADAAADRKKAQADINAKAAEATAKAKEEEAKKLEDLNKANTDKFQAEQDYLDKVNDLLQSEESKRILSVAKTYDDLIEQAAQFGFDTTALEAARGVAIQGVIDATEAEKQKKRDETNAKELADQQAIADALLDVRLQLLDGIGASFGALANLLGEGTAAFKAAALAEIAISTATGFINALDIAQKSAKATGPAAAFAFPIFYASQIAAVLGAISAAKNVLSTVPGGGGGGSTPQKPSVGSAPSFSGGGAFTGALPGTGGTPPVTGQTEPIRAYVVAQDVSTGQEANAAIRRRRRLGPG